MRTEFSKFAPASNDILNNSTNKNLVKEIKPWLLHFATLWEASLAALDLLKAQDDQTAYSYFLKLQENRNQLIFIDQNNNRNPYQPGIVTGSRHILPFIEKTYFHFAQYLKTKGFKVPDAVDQANGNVVTNLAPLKSLPVLNDAVVGNKKCTPFCGVHFLYYI